MIKWISILFFLLPVTLLAQISFIRQHSIPENFDVTAYAELSNGHYVCFATSANKVVAYLFDACGEFITSAQLNVPGDYMGINSIVELDSSRFVASGWLQDSVTKSTHIILNSRNLDVEKQVKYFEALIVARGNSIMRNSRILLAGFRDDRVHATQLNLELSRNLHLQRAFNRIKNPEFENLNWIGTDDDRIYTREAYVKTGTHDYYNKIRCLDRKLRDRYVINFRSDSAEYNFHHSIAILGGDTILLGATIYKIGSSENEEVLLKYYKDTLISQQEITVDKNFSRYTTCVCNRQRIRCINYDGKAAEFDRDGNEIFQDDHLASILKEGDMSDAFMTRDGGFFRARHVYDGPGHAMKLIKITADYQLDSLPAPECIVWTEDPVKDQGIKIFPNPVRNILHIESKEQVCRFNLISLEGVSIIEGKPDQQDFDIAINVMPGMYVIVFQTKTEWISKKVLIIKN